jgi:hypothetical protein
MLSSMNHGQIKSFHSSLKCGELKFVSSLCSDTDSVEFIVNLTL